jgi:micrococcal nuclease
VSYQLRRRRNVRRVTFAGLVVLAASALLDRSGAFRYDGDDWRNFDHQAVIVAHVSDGDTLVVRPAAGGKETKVRLLGVDTPELHSRSHAGADYWAREAMRYTEARLDHKTVTLRLEATRTRDKYRRLLAYVYVGDADNFNLDLVRDGAAYADRRFPHSLKFQFEQAETEARKKGRGLWKGVTESQMPPWRREWLGRRRHED